MIGMRDRGELQKVGRLTKEVDLVGGDYAKFSLGPEYCRQMCMGDARCRSWTWAKPYTKNGEPYPACILRGSVPKAQKDACCTSGVK